MKEQESKAKKIVAIVLFFALVGAMIAGAWYYGVVVLDDSNNSNTTSDRQSSGAKDLTATEEIEAAVTGGVEDIQQRTNADRGDLETIHQSTASANAVVSVVDQDLVDNEECTTIKSFGTASVKAIAAERKVMERTSKLLQSSLLARWSVKDRVSEAERKTVESSFSGLVTLYKKATAKSTDMLGAVDEYEADQLLALGTFYDDYNVAQTSYRNDQLSLIKMHDQALEKALDKFVVDVNQAVADAQQKCADKGASSSLVDEIIQLKKSFVEDRSKESTESLSQAAKLLETRNKEVSRITETFLRQAHDLRLALENSK